MKLSLVFPAYNEAQALPTVLEQFSDYLNLRGVEHEIIVVNDGSRDATSAVVQDCIRSHPTIRLIEHTANQGYGAALRSGFTSATGDFIFFTDSDGQFQPADLDQTLPLINPTTMLLGYREKRSEGFGRKMNAALWGAVIHLLLGLRVRDLNCAWKVFPRSLLTQSTLTARGAFINAELLWYAKHRRFQFKELPVHHFPRQSGSPTGADPRVIWRAFRELVFFLRLRPRAKPQSAGLPESNN